MPLMWVRNAVTEGVGAFVLTFVAVMTIGTNDLVPYALGQGLAIVALIAALGHVSGGHFNPVVTLAVYLGRGIDLPGAAIYWAAQLIGGLIAAALAALTVSRELVARGAPVPSTGGELNLAGAVTLEAVAVFVVVLAVFGTVIDQRAPLSAYPFAIGLAYSAGILAIGAMTGGALNPARAFGPAVVGGEWGGVASWLFGPVIGAVAAWAIYEYLIGKAIAQYDVEPAEEPHGPGPASSSVPRPDDDSGTRVSMSDPVARDEKAG